MPTPFTIKTRDSALLLQGDLDIIHFKQAQKALEKALNNQNQSLDLSGLEKLDTAGALLLRQLEEKHHISLQHLKTEHKKLFKLVAQTTLETIPEPKKDATFIHIIKQTGRHTIAAYHWLIQFIAFIGQVCVNLLKSFRNPRHFRFNEIMHHLEQTGIQAIPIISAMAFMIAIVLCYQGVAQLRPMGAQNLSVNLVALSVLREMGVLLTAIMVAGRSGSAFAAEIGVMKVREEVDALQVIGIDPFEILIMPRLIALLIALPLLTFIADITGLLGGGLMSNILIGIPFGAYIDKVRVVAHGHDFLVGMIKAPVFAFLIAMVGCMHGMKVSGSAESVGHETTAAVVKAIFLVLIADAFFSILFDKLGI